MVLSWRELTDQGGLWTSTIRATSQMSHRLFFAMINLVSAGNQITSGVPGGDGTPGFGRRGRMFLGCQVEPVTFKFAVSSAKVPAGFPLDFFGRARRDTSRVRAVDTLTTDSHRVCVSFSFAIGDACMRLSAC